MKGLIVLFFVAEVECGELLASFELLLGGLEDAPPTRGNVYMVPFDVRPRLQKTRIEVNGEDILNGLEIVSFF